MAVTILQPQANFFTLPSNTNWTDSTLDAPAVVPDNAQITITFTVAPNNDPVSIDFELTGAEWNARTNAVIGNGPLPAETDILRSSDFVSLNFNTYNLNFGGTADGSFVFANGTGVTGVVSSIIGLRIAIDDHMAAGPAGVDEDEVNRLIDAKLADLSGGGQAGLALQVLSLDELKKQLNLPLTHVSDDDKLTSIIDEAVSIVSRETGLPLLTEQKVVFADVPESNDDPMVLEVNDYLQHVTIEYWQDGQDLKEAPTGGFSTGSGRVVELDGKVLVYSQFDWPVPLENTRYKVTVNVGLKEIPEGIKRAVILLSRHLFNGAESWPARSAYDRIVSQYARKAGAW